MYAEFRSGLTFSEVRYTLMVEQHAARARGEDMYVTRHTVMGRWKQLKLAMWAAHKKEEHGCKA